MGSAAKDQLIQMATYHHWATERLLASTRLLPEDIYREPCGLFFGSIHGTLNHLLLADSELWYARFAEGRSPSLALDTEIEQDRRVLADRLIGAAARWPVYVDGLDEAALNGELTYRTTAGELRELPIAAALLHVFNHATHHRGQITAALSRAGYSYESLDLLGLIILRAAQGG